MATSTYLLLATVCCTLCAARGDTSQLGVDAATGEVWEETLASPTGNTNTAWLLGSYDPLPHPEAVVTHGPSRFTVLTAALVRMEYSPHSPPVFHDSGSMAIVNRRFPSAPPFTTDEDGSKLVIRTDLLTLTYDHGVDPSGGFTANNLRVEIHSVGAEWTPGKRPTGSLHGTIRTLDRIGRALSLECLQPAYLNDTHCEEGVVSRDGWAVVDDSQSARWEDYSAIWPWTTGPAEPAPLASPDTCAAVGWDRWECIWGNVVNETACHAKGCCFDGVAAAAAHGQPTPFHFVPWCWWPGAAAGRALYTDLYMFGHGHDFEGALKDYRAVAGTVPMVPRWELGPAYSRWFDYHQFEELELVTTFGRHGVPLDTQIVDMGWHNYFPRGLPSLPEGLTAGEVEPWTGFSLWKDMFPSTRDMVAFFHARGVRTLWNLHPHYGIQFYDDIYHEFAAELGRQADAEQGKPLLGDYTNLTWAEPFFRLAISRLDDLGIDAWWLDWQQGEWTPVHGLSPTAWISYLFSSNPYRYASDATRAELGDGGHKDGGEAHVPWARAAALQHSDASRTGSRNGVRLSDRPLVMNRWGGLGSHRYPVGFSGDADTNWGILEYQAYITPTAANVAFQWSHDIGGFAGEPAPELMVRWVQFGVFSPILRPHTAGKSGAIRDIWAFPFTSYEIMRDFFRLRARLIPHLATAQRKGHDTGLVTVRPLYYSWPEAEGAYTDSAQRQYWFGEGVWVAPITEPAPSDHASAGLALKDLWLPPGPWIEWMSWTRLEGLPGTGSPHQRRYAINEMPIFSRPGTILTLRTLPPDVVGSAGDIPTDLTFWVFPADPVALSTASSAAAAAAAAAAPEVPAPSRFDAPTFSSRTRFYDDDGVSVAYLEGQHAFTDVECSWYVDDFSIPADEGGAAPSLPPDGDLLECVIFPARGAGFPSAPATRQYSFRFAGTLPPQVVLINDAEVPLTQAGVPDQWGDLGRWPAPDAPGAGNAWAYSATTASTWVRVGEPQLTGLQGDSDLPPEQPLVTVTLVYPRMRLPDGEDGSRTSVVGHPLLTRGLPRKIARAQAVKGLMNKVSWQVTPPDVPSVVHAFGVPSRVESGLMDAHLHGPHADPVADGNGEVPSWASPSAGAASVAIEAALSEFDALSKDLRFGWDETIATQATHGVGDDIALRMMGLLNDCGCFH